MFHASCHAATSHLLQSGTSQPIIPSVMLRGCGVCFHGCRVRVWGAARRPLPLPAQCPVPSAQCPPPAPVPGSQVPQSPVPSAHRLAPTTQRPGAAAAWAGLGRRLPTPRFPLQFPYPSYLERCPRVSPCPSSTSSGPNPETQQTHMRLSTDAVTVDCRSHQHCRRHPHRHRHRHRRIAQG